MILVLEDLKIVEVDGGSVAGHAEFSSCSVGRPKKKDISKCLKNDVGAIVLQTQKGDQIAHCLEVDGGLEALGHEGAT